MAGVELSAKILSHDFELSDAAKGLAMSVGVYDSCFYQTDQEPLEPVIHVFDSETNTPLFSVTQKASRVLGIEWNGPIPPVNVAILQSNVDIATAIREKQRSQCVHLGNSLSADWFPR